MWSIWGAGLLTGLALILAIGAQNAFLLRQGIRREHVGLVVLLCVGSDTVLILGGTLGIGVLVSQFPAAMTVLKWTGAAYMAWWAARSFRSALKPLSLDPAAATSRGSIISSTLAVTYLNPYVYLDTVVLLGSLANQHGPEARWFFAAGAVAGSALWFPALGYGARALSGVLSGRRAWRAVELLTGAVMLAFAVKLILS